MNHKRSFPDSLPREISNNFTENIKNTRNSLFILNMANNAR